MIAIFSLLLVLVLSLLITRIATIALTYTGLSRQSAKFQARSAFTGVGFTTSESEKVVNHPVRRRVLLIRIMPPFCTWPEIIRFMKSTSGRRIGWPAENCGN